MNLLNSDVELLAPAGNFEALKAAVEAGADAVYLAGDHFGARAFAGNFSNEELKKAVEFAHLRGVKIHVTVNTIVSDDEFENLADYLRFLEKINIDAVLIQDLGVASLVRRVAPNLFLHASTQMTVHSLEGVKALEELGFSRVVLSRELSIAEIKNICEHSTAEIEVFMHGALCVCYSGQCLMSSMIGARSGNRGKCAQPCRLPYELVDENGVDVLKDKAGQYLLSPKDLNTIDLLPQLIEAGVCSLKIEGRMKRPEYVAIVVETYRKAIDSYLKNPSEYKATDESHKNLAQIFNRDFTTAYLEKIQGKNMISDKRPNNRGLLIGRVAAIYKNKISIKVTEKINNGDQIEIWIKVGGRVTITVKDFHFNEDICTINTAENIRGVKVHDRVFKVFDAELTAHARKFFTSAAPLRKIPIIGEVKVKLNEPLTLKFSLVGGDFVESSTKFIAEPAKNQPLTVETIDKQIKRLGNSVFELIDCQYYIDDNVMIPISEINEVRRKAIQKLEEKMREERRVKREEKIFNNEEKLEPRFTTQSLLLTQVDTIEKIKIAINAGVDAILFGGESYNHKTITAKDYQQAIEMAHNADKKIYIATPRIVRNSEQSVLEEILTNISDADGVYVHNIATLHLAKRLTKLPIHTDFSLIAFNSETINFLKFLGVESVTLSPELALEQIKNLNKKTPLPVECIVYGRAELMISSYCVAGSFIGGVGEHKCSEPCKRQKYFLRDRKSEIFPIVTDQFCRMHILNTKPLSMLPHVKTLAEIGVKNLRIDGRALNEIELSKIIRDYKLALDGESLEEKFDFTRGHYFRGV